MLPFEMQELQLHSPEPSISSDSATAVVEDPTFKDKFRKLVVRLHLRNGASAQSMTYLSKFLTRHNDQLHQILEMPLGYETNRKHLLADHPELPRPFVALYRKQITGEEDQQAVLHAGEVLIGKRYSVLEDLDKIGWNIETKHVVRTVTDFNTADVINYLIGHKKHRNKEDDSWKTVDLAVDGVPESESGTMTQIIVAVSLVGCGDPHLLAVFRRNIKTDYQPTAKELIMKYLRQIKDLGYKLRWTFADSVERKARTHNSSHVQLRIRIFSCWINFVVSSKYKWTIYFFFQTLLGLQGTGAHFGCDRCLIKGHSSKRWKTTIYPSNQTGEPRTAAQHRQDVHRRITTNTAHSRGAVNNSPFAIVFGSDWHFHQVPIDCMHLMDLGCTRSIWRYTASKYI